MSPEHLRGAQGASDPRTGIEILGPVPPAWRAVLSPAALEFVTVLERVARPRRAELLDRRGRVQAALDSGARLRFPEQTAAIRAAEWTVAPIPADLEDRRVEITGPTDRKMIINALNSGANVFMADFEDATSPTWANVIEGQINLREAVRRTLRYRQPTTGRNYALDDRVATLMVRPRGWHLSEKHVLVDGHPVSASIFDFALFFFHNAAEQIARGTGPYFYLPKLEGHLEARLWNDVFLAAQARLGIPRGTIRATVLVETLPAAFEMDEILWELREHSAGLNCGRWDYIFSFIKKRHADAAAVLPDRAQVTMDRGFLAAYSRLLVRTCHRRGAHAMGGMAAQIPIKSDVVRNEAAIAKVRADKLREARAGHDGTWVAHPGLVAIAREEFDAVLAGPNQIRRRSDDAPVAEEDLLAVPEGSITERGLRQNLSVGVRYLEAWLRGQGCVPLDDLMEDAATAEISRSQVWQWLRHESRLSDGRAVGPDLVRGLLADELIRLRESVGEPAWRAGRFEEAQELFEELMLAPRLPEWLTVPAYDRILSITPCETPA